jgi:hypothetical protein
VFDQLAPHSLRVNAPNREAAQRRADAEESVDCRLEFCLEAVALQVLGPMLLRFHCYAAFLGVNRPGQRAGKRAQLLELHEDRSEVGDTQDYARTLG